MKRSPAPLSLPVLPAADPDFSGAVVAWQQAHGRHTLPWQNTRDPYRIWLSEIMLQQTQVSAVLGYYARFLDRFPTLSTLAEADVGEVMAQWSGLGYYTRARNLHRCAQRVMTEHGGVFPGCPQRLADLPGIGRSTAAAIAAFSYGVRAAILDGNVKRVFARVFGIPVWPGEKAVEQRLWRHAEALLPDTGIGSYTQGLMDLGATLCTRTKPACARCPLRERCVAHATGQTGQLPVRKPKKTIPDKHATMLVIVDRGQVLLERRAATGIWGGLLSLPELDGHTPFEHARPAPDAPGQAAAQFGRVGRSAPLAPVIHVFTHYRLHIAPVHITLEQRDERNMSGVHQWWNLSDLASCALPAPVRKLLEQHAVP